jgi:ParB family transcriptional regulator, chromosome partitioning protein
MNKEPDHNPRKALGKGLSALLPNRSLAVMPKSAEPVERSEELQSIPLDQIRPNEEQPRASFDAGKLQELAQSISANGLIQPITVYKSGPDAYTIIAGERRWRAAQLAGLKAIPALVRSIEKHQRLELALIENVQREDLNPIEIAMAFDRLASDHGLTHDQIAERTGKDRSTVTNFLRLLKLSPLVRNEVVRGTISVGHARALLNISDDRAQRRACEQIIAGDLSVRDTERLVKHLTAAETRVKDSNIRNSQAQDPNVRAALDEIAMALGTKVRLVPKSQSAGRLEIEYYSQDDLDRIYSLIVKS